MLATTPSANTQSWSYCKEPSPYRTYGVRRLPNTSEQSHLAITETIQCEYGLQSGNRIGGDDIMGFIAIMLSLHDMALGAALLLPSLLEKPQSTETYRRSPRLGE